MARARPPSASDQIAWGGDPCPVSEPGGGATSAKIVAATRSRSRASLRGRTVRQHGRGDKPPGARGRPPTFANNGRPRPPPPECGSSPPAPQTRAESVSNQRVHGRDAGGRAPTKNAPKNGCGGAACWCAGAADLTGFRPGGPNPHLATAEVHNTEDQSRAEPKREEPRHNHDGATTEDTLTRSHPPPRREPMRP